MRTLYRLVPVLTLALAACSAEVANSPDAGQGGTPSTNGGATTAAGGVSSGGSGNGGSFGGAAIAGSAGLGGATAPGGAGQGGQSTGGVGGSAVSGGAGGSTASTQGGSASGGVVSGGSSSGGKAQAGSSSGGASGGASSGGATSGGAASGGSSSTAPVKIWIAGDSTVQSCSSACPCGWGGQFDALFNSNVTVTNSAVGGRSIQTWLYEGGVTSTLANGECTLSSTAYNARWNAMTNATSGMKAGDYLFIQFGINDGDRTCPRHVGSALYKTYLGVMAKAAKDRGAIPIFVTPVSSISCNSSGKAQGTRGFLTETNEAGVANGVTVIDLHQLSIDLYNKLGLCPNNLDYTQGAVGAFFCADHTHFEAAGAKQIAQVMAQALRDKKLGLAGYLL